MTIARKEIDATFRIETVRIGKAILKERVVQAGPKNVGLIRQREIERIITSRHGGTVPDPQDTEDRDTALAYARAVAFSMTGQAIAPWAQRWAPWMRSDEIEAIEWDAQQRNRMLRADAAARFLGVRYEERVELKLRTIGSCNVSRAKRDELARKSKQKRDRERQERLSREAGRKKRDPNEEKPWEIAGVSRRTWYRKKAWHSFIANKSLIKTGEKSVPNLVSSLENEKVESSSGLLNQPRTLHSQGIRSGNAETKSVPRPQALVAEGSSTQGAEGCQARTRERDDLTSLIETQPSYITARRTA